MLVKKIPFVLLVPTMLFCSTWGQRRVHPKNAPVVCLIGHVGGCPKMPLAPAKSALEGSQGGVESHKNRLSGQSGGIWKSGDEVPDNSAVRSQWIWSRQTQPRHLAHDYRILTVFTSQSQPLWQKIPFAILYISAINSILRADPKT